MSYSLVAPVGFGPPQVAMGDCYSDDPHVNDAKWHVKMLAGMSLPGSVIILHCPEADNHRAQTLQILGPLVEELRAKGLQCVTLQTLFPMVERDPTPPARHACTNACTTPIAKEPAVSEEDHCGFVCGLGR